MPSSNCGFIHDFHNGGHRESPGSSCMKTRSERPTYHVASRRVPPRLLWRVLRMFQNPTFLTENDIPGASLLGRKPEELKISEIKFWLKCCGDAVKRGHDYIQPWFLGRTRAETAFILF